MDRLAGIDLGAKRDYAVVVVADQSPGLLDVTDVDRFRLGHWGDTSARVSTWLGEVDFAAADASGVGAPVVEGLGENVAPVVITSGNSLRVEPSGAVYVAKRVLVDLLSIALSTKRLRVTATGPNADRLRQELREFVVKPDGSMEGIGHDDCVMALALLVLAPVARRRLELMAS